MRRSELSPRASKAIVHDLREREGRHAVDDQEPDLRTLTNTLAAAERGDVRAAGEMFSTLYRELHRLARRQLHANASGLTLVATTLLHEAYIDISARGAEFPDRARFFAYAARAMRGLIIDYVRERHAIKRGGEFHLTSLDTQIADAVPRVVRKPRMP